MLEYDVEVTMNDFYLSLPANYTTGYQWKVLYIDKNKLKYIKTDYISQTNKLGAGGVAQLYFRPLKRGTTILKLIYKRSWEDQGTIFTYYINIE
jgi:inhibitor of cysteine peptidase